MQTRAAPRATGSLPHGERLRAAGFIVTIYGDVVEPRGGLLWMGTLIEVCARAGISETRVRTAVSRLMAAGRLEGTREGRRSFYRLTPSAATEFADAAARIFSPPPPPRAWIVALQPAAETEAALLLRGFASVGPGVLLGADDGERPGSGIVLRADWLDGRPELRRLAAERWRLPELAAAYGGFIDRFAPLAADLRRGRPLDAETTLLARLLLVHGFRAVVLADPRLPAEALPDDWPAPYARRLFAGLYLRLSAAADSHVARRFTSLAGPLPPETAATQRRIRELKVMCRA